VTRPGPALLRADNFTPPTRTPWGGTRLVSQYKPARALSEVARGHACVGESWEVSVEPDFPGSLEDGTPLADWLAAAPADTLGEEHVRGRSSTALLVKLIDTAEPLSVQIHPADDYPGLAPGECGKPESWYVVAREPGAGLYLGFQRGTTEADVREALAGSRAADGTRSLRELLRFVPVEPGDFFVIDAGTPHAIGAGLTLVEPQHVVPGQRGVTYRYWDWDRRYDAHGNPDPAGAPRPLHVEHALGVTRFAEVAADDFIPQICLRAGEPQLDHAPIVTPLCGAAGGLANPFLSVARLAGTGSAALPSWQRLLGVTVLSGTLTVEGVTLERGRSAVVPAWLGGAAAQLSQCQAIVTAVG
jgi:hypothetical protein